MVRRLKMMHTLGYIHRDLKPANIAVGYGKKENTIYLIDFGLSKKMNEGGQNLGVGGPNVPKKMAGTPIYTAVTAHLGTGECYKKDDIESLMYVLIQLVKGSLPWQNAK